MFLKLTSQNITYFEIPETQAATMQTQAKQLTLDPLLEVFV